MGGIKVDTREREELVDFTDDVRAAVRESGVRNGVIHLWSLHTVCAITVNEGADPAVGRDIATTLRRLTALVGPGETLLIEDGELVVGTWQKVFLAEWDGPRGREVAWQVLAQMGE